LVDPSIAEYIRANRDNYTREAIRDQLLAAGHDREAIDAGWRAVEAEATGAPQGPPASRVVRRRFWRWAFGLHAAVLVVIGILSLVIGSFAAGSWGLLIILAVALLIGLGISGLVGRGVVHGSGLTVALVLPAISALLIGGSCLALGGSYLLRAPPRTGVMEIHIDPPLRFDGSGVAYCQDSGGTSGFLVWTEELGTLDGKVVNVSFDASTGGVDQGQGAEAMNLSINLNPHTDNERPVAYSAYSPDSSTRVELDASPDGRSGTLRFEGLEPALLDRPPGEASGLEPISGTVTWTCK
jgi:hypothetical protein